MKKKIIISYLIGIITMLIIGSVGATILYNAKDIEYKDTNVEDAIDDLYSSFNKNLKDNILVENKNFNIKYTSSYSSYLDLNDLELGKYIIYIYFYGNSNGATSYYKASNGSINYSENSFTSVTSTSYVAYRPLLHTRYEFSIDDINKDFHFYVKGTSSENVVGYYTLIKID